jgi:hypothetical protein
MRKNPDVSSILLLAGGLVGSVLLFKHFMDRRAAQQAALTTQGRAAGAAIGSFKGLTKPPAKSQSAADRLRYEYRTGSAGRACFDKQTQTFTNIEKCDAAFVLEGVGGIFSGGRGLGSL